MGSRVLNIGRSLDEVTSYQSRQIASSNRRMLGGFSKTSVLILSGQTLPPFMYARSVVSEHWLYDWKEPQLVFKKFPKINEFNLLVIILIIMIIFLTVNVQLTVRSGKLKTSRRSLYGLVPFSQCVLPLGLALLGSLQNHRHITPAGRNTASRLYTTFSIPSTGVFRFPIQSTFIHGFIQTVIIFKFLINTGSLSYIYFCILQTHRMTFGRRPFICQVAAYTVNELSI